MAKNVDKIDPNADTVIVLRNANAEFAPWVSHDGQVNAIGQTGRAGAEGLTAERAAARDADVEERSIDEPDVEEPSVIEIAIEEPDVEDPSVEEIAIEGTLDLGPHGDAANTSQAAHTSESTSPKDLIDSGSIKGEVYYRVSRRHLMSASPAFQQMLSGENWEEGTPDKNDHLYHATAEAWDSEALLCVLQILHHRNRQVPRTITLEMLAKIAVLIDYYDCAEALEPFTERWVEDLRKSSPVRSHTCRDLVLWLCIAWVLKLPREFVQATTVATKGEEQELLTLGLPITICVEKIEEVRRREVSTVLRQLQDLLQSFRNSQYQCPYDRSFECGSMLYGALYKEMELQGLSLDPEAPAHGLSLLELDRRMRRIRAPSWGVPHEIDRYGNWGNNRHGCELGEKIVAIATGTIGIVRGPELNDFKS